VDHRPTLSILRLVYTTTPGTQVYTTTQRPLRCKRPPGPGTSLRTTLLQDPALTATNGSWAAPSTQRTPAAVH
jgi:argonaute-like protein implicated in RNA metabolism and viral defense